MNFISLCSGIEAASVAFGPLGWKAIAFSEIEGFPSAVLAHHYPTVRNYGDMSLFRDWPDELFADADAIVGGPPCQAFSVAGARRGLLDARGNLTLIYVELLDHADDIRRKYGKPPVVALYENVPGIFSDRTNAFGCLVGGLAGEDVPVVPPGKRWTDAGCVFGPERAVAWRLFDAQFFALAQRRRRVFVVASARKGFDPAQVLFEWDGVRRDTAPSREARQTAPTIPARSTAGGGLGTDFDCDGGTICVATGQAGAEIGAGMAPTLNCNHEAPIAAYTINFCDTGGSRPDRRDGGLYVTETDTSGALTCAEATTKILQQVTRTSANGRGISPELAHTLDCAQGVAVAQPVAFHPTQDPISSTDGSTHALGCGSTGGQASVAVAFAATGQAGAGWAPPSFPVQEECSQTLDTRRAQSVMTATQVRRLTPTEAEKLQGLEPGYTAIPWRGKPADQCPDGPRYRALGNSWAVPNVRWIGERIARQINSSTNQPAPSGLF